MKNKVLSALAIVLAASATVGAAQAADNGHAVQILGFHLGMKPNEVAVTANANLKDPIITPDVKKLTLNSFTTPGITFGADIKEGTNTAWYNTPNTEYMKVNYSVDDNPQVIYISRYRIFDKSTAPVISTFINSVIAKYGNPVLNDHRVPNYLLTWNYGATVKHTEHYSPDNTLFTNCNSWVSIGFGQNPFNRMRAGDINLNRDEVQRFYPRCGTTMTLAIMAMPPDYQLARQIEFDIGDFKLLVASYNRIWSQLSAGAAAAAAALKGKAAGNAPRL